MRVAAALACAMIALSPSLAEAQVRVSGYTRSDGTYVRPYIRSSPDASLSNNYGASRSSPLYSPSLPDLGVVTPSTRDHDHDGIANMHDADDDNDGVGDAHDQTQYGRVTASPYLFSDQIIAQYERDTRNFMIELYNEELRAARADGVITASERSYLAFQRELLASYY